MRVAQAQCGDFAKVCGRGGSLWRWAPRVVLWPLDAGRGEGGDGRNPALPPECDPMSRTAGFIPGDDGGNPGCPSVWRRPLEAGGSRGRG